MRAPLLVGDEQVRESSLKERAVCVFNHPASGLEEADQLLLDVPLRPVLGLANLFHVGVSQARYFRSRRPHRSTSQTRAGVCGFTV